MADNPIDASQVDLRAALIALTRQGEADEQALRAQFSPEQRAATGTLEHWAPKENIAHLAFWKRKQIARLEAVTRGETASDGPDFQQVNEESWPELARLTWDEAVARSDAATRDLIAALERLPESALTPTPLGATEPSQGDLLTSTTIGNGFGHIAEHRAFYAQDNGDTERATQINRDVVASIRAAGLGPAHEGAARYNLACYLALHGQPAEAIAELRVALPQRPDLVAWSRGDHDLDSLRDDPTFQALIPPEPPAPAEGA